MRTASYIYERVEDEGYNTSLYGMLCIFSAEWPQRPIIPQVRLSGAIKCEKVRHSLGKYAAWGVKCTRILYSLSIKGLSG